MNDGSSVVLEPIAVDVIDPKPSQVPVSAAVSRLNVLATVLPERTPTQLITALEKSGMNLR